MDGGSLLQNLASPERTRGPRGCGERLAAVHPDTTSPASRVKHTHRDTHTVSQALLTAPTRQNAAPVFTARLGHNAADH
jgi:hypothetical protein